ncbi:MAG: polyphosphate polymerase domain-containing protein [Christensenellales bacterium]|jgi:hypothetical protein
MPGRNNKPYRHELKYFINRGAAVELKTRLLQTMDLDKYARARGGRYHIRSLYFDDAIDSAVREKLDGVEERKKFRIRIYNYSDQEIFLECKQKSGQYIRKYGTQIDRNLCDEICAGHWQNLLYHDAPICRELYYQMSCRFLRPSVIVDYARTPFVARYQDVRITFDDDLRTGVFSKDLFDPYIPTVPALDSYDLILEVKFNEYLPDYYHRLVQTDYAVRSAASKYVICRKFEAT